ncbi:Bax inhibitor-1/YccA family protein [Candidatus Dependentiae bacterium]
MEFPEYPYPREEYSAANFMYKVYGWMSLGLAVTAGVAFYIFKNPSLYAPIEKNPWLLIVLIILQLVLVIVLSAFILKLSFPVAFLLFLFYAFTVGVTFSFIFQVYIISSIYATFFVTSGMFAITCLYGYFTKADLTAMGSFAFMALIGLILTGLVNMFLQSAMLDYIYSAVGVIVFTLLTAYDSQKIKQMARRLMGSAQMRNKIAIMGALTLYLDFINLFLFLLRFMGKKEN